MLNTFGSDRLLRGESITDEGDGDGWCRSECKSGAQTPSACRDL